jgi:predicted amidohydrolase YtcJ
MVRWFSVCSSLVLLLSCGTTDTPRPRAQPRPAEGAAAGARTAATLVLVGGKVHTLDPAQPTATAVAIAGDRIVEVGTDEAVGLRIGPNTKVIDLGGKTVLPGLADAHLHLFGLGSRGRIVDLTATRSIKDVRDRVAAAAKGTSAGAWVQGRGWDQNDWSDRQAPGPSGRVTWTRSHGRRAGGILWRVDGHAVWVNTEGPGAGPGSAATCAPRGGGPGGDAARRSPAGCSWTTPWPWSESARPRRPGRRSSGKRVLAGPRRSALASRASREVHDMGLVPLDELAVLRALDLDRAGERKLRIYAAARRLGRRIWTPCPGRGPAPCRPLDGPLDASPCAAVKFYAGRGPGLARRGAVGGRTATTPAITSGLVVTDPAAAGGAGAERPGAPATRWPPTPSATGPTWLALDVYEPGVRGPGVARARPRIEHAQVHGRGDDLSRFGQEGVIASLQPTHATSDMPWAEKRGWARSG